MAKQLEFVFHPHTQVEVDEERVRREKQKAIEYLVNKALERASFK